MVFGSDEARVRLDGISEVVVDVDAQVRQNLLGSWRNRSLNEFQIVDEGVEQLWLRIENPALGKDWTTFSQRFASEYR